MRWGHGLWVCVLMMGVSFVGGCEYAKYHDEQPPQIRVVDTDHA